MRRINKLFLTGCAYTVIILALFFIFAAISKVATAEISPRQFTLVLAFGMIISCAEFMYEALKIKKIYKCLIHYFVLMIAFYVVFIKFGKLSSQGPARVFVAIFLYTAFYFIVWTIVHFLKKGINKADDALDKKTANIPATKSKGAYKSLYSDSDV